MFNSVIYGHRRQCSMQFLLKFSNAYPKNEQTKKKKKIPEENN